MPLARFSKALMLLVVPALAVAGAARADDQIVITLKNDQFTPAEVTLPANTDVTLKFVNDDPAAAEIESKDLKIEKVVAGNSEITVHVHTQEPGRYLFVNEYKEDTVKGYIIVN